MIAVKGSYDIKIPIRTMFLNTELIVHGENLITLLGESFFMNRWVNDEFDPICYIKLGKGTSRPVKTDEELGKLTVNKNCSYEVNLTDKKIVLYCDCSASEIVDTCEIGVGNDEILISHDIFEPITTEILLDDTTSLIHIEYAFNLLTGGLRSNWTPSKEGNNIYYIYEPSKVVGVVENNSNSGYSRKNSIEELKNETGVYYFDNNSNNLYIVTTNAKDPNTCEIIVQTK